MERWCWRVSKEIAWEVVVDVVEEGREKVVVEEREERVFVVEVEEEGV